MKSGITNIILLSIWLINIWSLFLGKKLVEHKIHNLVSTTSSVLIITSFAILLFAYISNDFSIGSVYWNSHSLMPLKYKIAATWSSYEGSILLILMLMILYRNFFTIYGDIHNFQRRLINFRVQSMIILVFLTFFMLFSNPFYSIYPIPQDGAGINPVLEDVGLIIHPPILYIGSTISFIIFSYGFTGLIYKKIDEKFLSELKNLSLLSTAFTSIGVGLGSWWAYRELGWGGYWFWDPVENISIIIWLSQMILLHLLFSKQYNKKLKDWIIIFSVLNFVLFLLSILFIRSSIIISVHSFTENNERFMALFLVFLIITAISLIVMAKNLSKLELIEKPSNENITIHNKRRYVATLCFVIILALSVFIMILSVLYPSIFEIITKNRITISENFYNITFSIISIISAILLIIVQYIKNYKKFLMGISIVIGLILSLFIGKYIVTILFFTGIVGFFYTSYNLYTGIVAFNIKKTCNIIAHLGFFVIIIGIVLNNSFDQKIERMIGLNEEITIDGIFENYKIKPTNFEYTAQDDYITRIVNFNIYKNHIITKKAASLRFYPVTEQMTSEITTNHAILSDIQIIVGGFDVTNNKENPRFMMQIYYEPFILLVWLGIGMMSLGTLGFCIERIRKN